MSKVNFNKKGFKTTAKITSVCSSALLGILILGSMIANKNENAINNFLKINPYKTSQDGETVELYTSKFNSVSELVSEGKKTVEEIASEGITLLKNDNSALPLASNSKVSLLSVSSINPAYGGRGSAQASNPQTPVTPKEGLTNAGLQVNDTLINYYTENKTKLQRASGKINDASWSTLQEANVTDSIKNYGDCAIMILTRVGGEGNDFVETGSDGENGDYLSLSENEKSVLKGLKALKDSGEVKKIVVLFNTANPIQTSFLDSSEYSIDAALWIGTTGCTGFNAVGKILTGEVNPSGHLADTYYYNHDDNPVMANYGSHNYPNYLDYDLPTETIAMKKYDTYVVYQEGIYIGYRYTETRYYDTVTNRENCGTFDYDSVVSHPFGFGLSYTSFEYSNFSIEEKDDSFIAKVTVTNTGLVSGKDALQIYVSKPYTEYDVSNSIEKSAVELVGYKKSDLLEPNESKEYSITIDKEDLKTYDSNNLKTYFIEGGDYYFTIGEDSHNATNNILAAQGKTTSSARFKAGSSSLVNKVTLTEDLETYATSENGTKITNLFDEADMNKYSGKNKNFVTYVTRSDWKNTLPSSIDDYVELKMTSGLAEDLLNQDDPSKNIEPDDGEYPTYSQPANLNLSDMIQDEQGNDIPFDSEKWDTYLNQFSFDELNALTYVGLRKTAGNVTYGKPETIESNGPCGVTSSYDVNSNGLATKKNDPDKTQTPPDYPCLGILSATFNDELASKYGEMLGEDALWAGYSGLYGIGVNMLRSPYQGRSYEYYSEDPFLCGTIATNEVISLQEKGCNAYVKHFALNEQETQRNGVSVWLNEQTLREIYLRPFEKCVVKGKATNAMASFTRIGAMYCPASYALMTSFLKGELGLKGFIVTDMYSIGYSTSHMPTFLMAGTDLPDGELTSDNPYKDYATNYSKVAWKIRESAKRILYATCHSNALNGVSKLEYVTPWWKTLLTSLIVVVSIIFVASIGLIVLIFISMNKYKNGETKLN